MSVTEKILKWLGVLLSAVAVVIVVAIVYVYVASERLLARTYAVDDTNVGVPADAPSVELGRRPATAVHIGPLGRLGLVLGQYPVRAALIGHEARRAVVDRSGVPACGREPPWTPDGPWAEAASRGVTFRALGNEPYWTFEVERARLTMITELGERRTELPYDEPSVVGTLAIWQAAAESHEIVAVTERRPCTDTMSGERFPVTVTVTFDGAAYRGCGRFL